MRKNNTKSASYNFKRKKKNWVRIMLKAKTIVQESSLSGSPGTRDWHIINMMPATHGDHLTVIPSSTSSKDISMAGIIWEMRIKAMQMRKPFGGEMNRRGYETDHQCLAASRKIAHLGQIDMFQIFKSGQHREF